MVYYKYRAYLKIWLAWKLLVECVAETIRHAFKICLKIENIRCAFKITIVWYPMHTKRGFHEACGFWMSLSNPFKRRDKMCQKKFEGCRLVWHYIWKCIIFLRSDIFLPFCVFCFNHFDVVIVLFRISRSYKLMLSILMIIWCEFWHGWKWSRFWS